MKNLRALGLRDDSIVADLGAGTGFYSIAAGQLVERGKVYAVELVKDFIETIRSKARDAHLGNVEVFWGDVEKIGGTKIKEGIVDVAIASNIFFQLEEKNKFIEETKRILKPKGRIFLVDWLPDSSVMKIKGAVPKEKAREMFEKKGFIFEREIDAGEHHYGIILVKS